MKRFILSAIAFIIIIASSPQVLPQNTAPESSLKEAKVFIDKAFARYDKNLMTQAKDNFGKIYAADKTNPLPLYYTTFAEYKLMEMSLKDKADNSFDKYYEEASSYGEKLSSTKGWESEGKTILAAIHMMKIAKSSMSAVTLSPTILELLGEAETIKPENPRAYVIHGTMLYNMPKMFGGSYKTAAENFRKAVAIYEKSDTAFTLLPTWGYLDALVWLGRSMAELDNLESAKFYYQKVLSISPEHGWVKYVLMPELDKKMKENK